MAEKPKKEMPKGGRKGGTIFPRLPLAKALEYSAKLVSKTHTGPMESNIVLVGVFGTAKSDGLIRSSALKQYGLLQSDDKGVQASSLARDIEAAPPNEKLPFTQKAFLAPKVFKGLYETFRGDTVSRAKLRQQAIGLKVHPDAADDCVEHFVSSLVAAQLGSESTDGVSLASAPASAGTATEVSDQDTQPPVEDEHGAVDEAATESEQNPPEGDVAHPGQDGPKAVFHVNVNLDASLDTEKLEKQLQLLRRYGAI